MSLKIGNNNIGVVVKADSSGSGGGSTDVQINGTSITSEGTANIVTEGTYNPLSNKIATMNDLPDITGIADNSINELKLTNEVITNKYNQTYNRFNPFRCLSNKSINPNTGAIKDNNNYYISDYIPVAKDEKLQFGILNNYNAVENRKPYYLVFFDASKVYVSQLTATNNVYEIPNDGYIVAQISNNVDRYKQILWNKDDSYFPYFRQNLEIGDNVYKNINYNDLNNAKNYIERFAVDLEMGGIEFATGRKVESGVNLTNRVRNKYPVSVRKNAKIIIEEGVRVDIIEIENELNTVLNHYECFNEFVFPNDMNCVNFVIRYTVDGPITINQAKESVIFKSVPEINYENTQQLLSNYPVAENTIYYKGETIDLSKKIKANSLTAPFMKGQDGAIYNDKLFSFSATGMFSVIDLNTLTQTKDIYLDQYQTITPHANCVCFGNEFYNENDTYPLLYVNAYSNTVLPKGTCYVYRVQESGSTYITTLLQTINIGFINTNLWEPENEFRPYGNFIVDTDNNHLYVYTLRQRENKTRFFKFNLPTLNDGNQITLNQPDIIEYFDTDWFYLIQGGCYYDNKLYVTNGDTSNNGEVHVIDLKNKSEVSSFKTKGLFDEPEMICIYNGTMYLSSGRYTLKKLNF